jgi:hypothetical protein
LAGSSCWRQPLRRYGSVLCPYSAVLSGALGALGTLGTLECSRYCGVLAVASGSTLEKGARADLRWAGWAGENTFRSLSKTALSSASSASLASCAFTGSEQRAELCRASLRRGAAGSSASGHCAYMALGTVPGRAEGLKECRWRTVRARDQPTPRDGPPSARKPNETNPNRRTERQ